jgi:hypothetical protein
MKCRGLLSVLSRWAALILVSVSAPAQAAPQNAPVAERTGLHALPAGAAQAPGDVRVGVFLYSVQELDIARHSFRVSFNIWWRYQGDGFDPIASLQVVNARAISVNLDDKRRLPNGENYVAAPAPFPSTAIACASRSSRRTRTRT